MTDTGRREVEVTEQNAAFSELPVLPRERIWGFWDFASVNAGLAIATWSFLGGGAAALFVGARAGIAAIIIGNLLGATLVALTTCIPSAKYGLEQYTALRSVFGTGGSRLLVFLIFPPLALGWNAILAIMFGRSATYVTNTVFSTDFGPNGVFVVGFALLALVISWFVLYKGPVSIEWLNKIVVPGLAIMTVVMLVLIFANRSWGELMAAEPISPFGNATLDFMIAIELNLAAGFSWWTIMGNLARLTTTQRVAFWPNMLGIFGAATLATIVGFLSALALGSSDPTEWMVPLGGAFLGILALVFIAFANITSMVSQTYAVALALFQGGGDVIRRLPWGVLAAILFAPAAVGTFFPAAVYDNYFKFIAWVSLALAPLCAVYFADFFLLRDRRLDLRGLYEGKNRSPYAFWGGFNPVAYLAVAAGSLTYFLMLNPLTYEQAGVFRYVSASMPAFVVAALVYVILTKLLVQPMGKGGYGEAARATQEAREAEERIGQRG